MKKLILGIFVILSLISGSVIARDVHVNGYYRDNGTYVQPHYRTAPDNNVLNNYSTQGNVNPYTGQAGTVNPYGAQQHNNENGYYNND